MMKKVMFIMEAALKAQTMSEVEWKEWAMKAAVAAGYTEEEAQEALKLNKKGA